MLKNDLFTRFVLPWLVGQQLLTSSALLLQYDSVCVYLLAFFAAYLCILLDQLGKLLGWVALANQSCPGCAGCPFLIFEKSFLLTQQVCSIVGGSSGTGTSLD